MRRIISFVLLIAIALLCTGCVFDCHRCEELEEEINELEWEYEEKVSELNDKIEETEEIYSALEEIGGYFFYAEECLAGELGPVDVAEALEAVINGMECVDDMLY